MDKAGVVVLAPSAKVFNGFHIDAVDLVALGKVLDACGAVDRRHTAVRSLKGRKRLGIGSVALEHPDPRAEQPRVVISEIVLQRCFQALLAALLLAGTDKAEYRAVVVFNQFV